jgi:hypothetical protein
MSSEDEDVEIGNERRRYCVYRTNMLGESEDVVVFDNVDDAMNNVRVFLFDVFWQIQKQPSNLNLDYFNHSELIIQYKKEWILGSKSFGYSGICHWDIFVKIE